MHDKTDEAGQPDAAVTSEVTTAESSTSDGTGHVSGEVSGESLDRQGASKGDRQGASRKAKSQAKPRKKFKKKKVKEQPKAVQHCDVVIGGGGLAGVLTAARLALKHPGCKIVVLEKEEELGGRLRSMAEGGRTSFGLNGISEGLFDFFNQTFKLDPEAPDLGEWVGKTQQSFGVVAGGKLKEAPVREWMTPAGSRVVGGFAAKRNWQTVTDILESPAAGTAREHVGVMWKGARKSPAAVVMEHYAHVFGIADVWSAAPEALSERTAVYQAGLHLGDFHEAIQALLELDAVKESVQVVTDAWILTASREGDGWAVETKETSYLTPTLVAAQPPWQVQSWLPRNLVPAEMLGMASKTKPSSLVVISDRVTEKEADAEPFVTAEADPEIEEKEKAAAEAEVRHFADMPDVLLIPAENTQVVKNRPDELAFQMTIDFEVSLQAPAVVKAVRSLRRARKKFMNAYPDVELSGEHISLVPYAWPQSPAGKDRRWLKKMTDKLNEPDLFFCGDAYGTSYDTDANIVSSVLRVCESVGARLADRQPLSPESEVTENEAGIPENTELGELAEPTLTEEPTEL